MTKENNDDFIKKQEKEVKEIFEILGNAMGDPGDEFRSLLLRICVGFTIILIVIAIVFS